MNGVCRVCGEAVDLFITSPNLCRNCVIKLKPGEHNSKYPAAELIIEKQCRHCDHLVESKGLPPGYENYWECNAGRIDERLPSGEYVALPFKRSGFERPNQIVAKAQVKCPYFKVHRRWLKNGSADPGTEPEAAEA